MRLVASGIELGEEINRCILECSRMSWAVAWASNSSDCFEQLKKNRDKIESIIVGVHFYQTHPDFLSEFIDDNRVKVVDTSEGVFHPKIYFFEFENGDWTCIVGSANFTMGAFTKNDEAAVVYTNKDLGSGNSRKSIKKILAGYASKANPITSEFVKAYRILWANRTKDRQRLVAGVGTKARKVSPLRKGEGIFTKAWASFYSDVVNSPNGKFETRCKILAEARELFRVHKSFEKFSEIDRKRIAGFSERQYDPFDWKVFGSMKGSGVFKKLVIENNPDISSALDYIPLSGDVAEEQYIQFVRKYLSAFGRGRGSGNPIATATRLLAMKRPDVFFCLDSKNRNHFSNEFGIIQSKINIESYWEEVVQLISSCVWWNESVPDDANQASVWRGRAAFLDSLFYAP